MSDLWEWIIHSTALGVLLTIVAVAALLVREVRFARQGPAALSDPLTIVAGLASGALLLLVLARFAVIA